jgi:hypothetical protein
MPAKLDVGGFGTVKLNGNPIQTKLPGHPVYTFNNQVLLIYAAPKSEGFIVNEFPVSKASEYIVVCDKLDKLTDRVR